MSSPAAHRTGRRNPRVAARADRSEGDTGSMNRVLLTGRLTRDPELRTTAGGKAVAQFSVASHEFVAGKEKPEFHSVVAWDRLAETCGRYLGKGQQVAIEGRLQTRSWDDDKGLRHWKTEIVAASVEMLSGHRRKDYRAETAAHALEAQAVAAGIEPDASEPLADTSGFSVHAGDEEDEEEDELLEEATAA
jgi:single-strand DNA-binding protein